VSGLVRTVAGDATTVSLSEPTVLGSGGRVWRVAATAERADEEVERLELVVKTSGSPHPWNGDRAAGLRREADTLREIGNGPVLDLGQELVGFCSHGSVLVTRYLPVEQSLADVVLHGRSSEVAPLLTQLAATLARLHHHLPASRIGSPALLSPWPSELADVVRRAKSKLGPEVRHRGPIAEDLDRFQTWLSLGSGDDALTHGDVCPDNVVLAADKMRLVDFEAAAVRPAAIDVAFLTMPFPSCWCCGEVPEEILRSTYDEYGQARRALNPAWTPDGRALALGTVYWALRHLTGPMMGIALARDPSWGPSRLRARLLRECRMAAIALQERAMLPDLCSGLDALHEDLVGRWGRHEMKMLPCFEPRGLTTEPGVRAAAESGRSSPHHPHSDPMS
jgi:hypothetical protein